MKRLAPLPVIQPSNPEAHLSTSADSSTNRQDCARCATAHICWAKGIRDDHIITNLLACRIQREIDVDRNVKAFLQVVRPKLKALAKQAIAGTSIDMDIALRDLEAQTVVVLQNKLVIGDIGYPLHYLFGIPKGLITCYAKNYAKKQKRNEAYEEEPLDETHHLNESYDPREAVEEEETSKTRHARYVIEDGITLTSLEYLVIRFCLDNAQHAKRPLNGLHVILAKLTGLTRNRITRIYADALEKIKEACE